MDEYIEREAFLAEQRHLYCENCARRKGMKNGKMKFVYAIGGVPCRACDIGDMLDSVEDYYPTADVAPVRHGEWIGYPECLAYEEAYSDDHIICSVCTKCFSVLDNCTETFKFCPNCGARMDGDA